jgi:anti-anti-sigma regulatory factor
MASNTSTKSRTGEKPRARSSSSKKKAPERKVTKKTTASKADKVFVGDSGQLVLMLDPVLVINNASDMHQMFSSYLDKSDNEIVIDASLVEMIDTAMIQLLFSLVNGLKSKNVRILWRTPSSEFVSRVRSLGLAEIFGIDIPVEG